MNTPSFLEDHVSQLPALQLLINMGYTYVSPQQAMQWRGDKTTNVLFENIVEQQLKKINRIERKGKTYEFSEANIKSAIIALKDLPLQEGFINANAAFYDLITLGKAFEQTIEGDKKSHSLQYVDWENPTNNSFHVSEEYSVLRHARSDHYRPDIVLFINGIPMGIIECKSPALNHTKKPVDLATEQHIRNFSKDGIRGLYVYSNLLLGLASNAATYATTDTSKEYWSKWRELFTLEKEAKTYETKLKKVKNQVLTDEVKDQLYGERFGYVRKYFDQIEQHERSISEQDRLLFSLCQKERILDLIHNFILFDDGTKKIARYQQYFAVKDTYKRVSKKDANGQRKGGVIWHTQGSGKSLTMVMLAQMIASDKNILNPKILLVTDRVDLDDQISDTFKKCQKEVIQATTGAHLAELLEDSNDAIVTTIINKFEAAVKQTKEPYQSSDIFVLIDEGHRTQYGTFNVKMEQVFPHACFIAFTGTPLMKKEKSTANKFGGYIGLPYTVNDAVEDGAVVPLLYEGRHNIMTINEDPINRFFDVVSEPLSDYGKANLKKKFNTVNELNKADQVILARAIDIGKHYTDFFQTKGDKYKPKAQLVAPSIKAALKYKEYLDDFTQVSSAVIVTQTDQREGTEDGYYNEKEDKAREDKYFNAMIDKYGSLDQFEKSVINQFKKREHPEILIVVMKLLTGFDAPNNTILYLCRSLSEHTLLQAVARVNRVYPGKDYGYIIDYYGNLENLDDALSTYSGLHDFDEKDLEGTLTKMKEELKKLPQAHSELWDVFKELKGKHLETTDYEEFLEPEDRRNRFYDKLSTFSRLLKMGLASVEFVNETDNKKLEKYKYDAKFFLKLRVDVKRRYNDDLSYKEFEPQIQKLIDKHISTEGEVMKVTELVDLFDQEEREAEIEKITGKAAKADHIASRTVKAINLKLHEDPIFYRKLADLIKETIQAYHQKRIDEAEFLKRAKEHEAAFLEGNRKEVPQSIEDNTVAITFYDFSKEVLEDFSLSEAEHAEIAKSVDEVIKRNITLNENRIIDWVNKSDVKGKITIEAGDCVYEFLEEKGLEPNWEIIDNLVEECIKVAAVKYQ
ncbi:MAG: HsdR family type I site-specific deoxyribonuclease [Vicingaceae bacterium]